MTADRGFIRCRATLSTEQKEWAGEVVKAACRAASRSVGGLSRRR